MTFDPVAFAEAHAATVREMYQEAATTGTCTRILCLLGERVHLTLCYGVTGHDDHRYQLVLREKKARPSAHVASAVKQMFFSDGWKLVDSGPLGEAWRMKAESGLLRDKAKR